MQGEQMLTLKYSCQGIARTQSPTNKNYALELPTFGVIVGVSPTEVQWKGLALKELPSWSQLTFVPGKYATWSKLGGNRSHRKVATFDIKIELMPMYMWEFFSKRARKREKKKIFWYEHRFALTRINFIFFLPFVTSFSKDQSDNCCGNLEFWTKLIVDPAYRRRIMCVQQVSLLGLLAKIKV